VHATILLALHENPKHQIWVKQLDLMVVEKSGNLVSPIGHALEIWFRQGLRRDYLFEAAAVKNITAFAVEGQ
jgi:hypothetical protein